MSGNIHPLAPHHLPFYLAPESGADPLMLGTGLFLLAVVFGVGILFWTLHSLPERIAHKSQKLQFELVAILGLISLFTHIHAFWIAALILAVIDIPDFGTPLRSIARSIAKIAGEADPERERVADLASDHPITSEQSQSRRRSHA